MEFYLVDIQSISCDLPASNFSSADIDLLADEILASGGLIRPLVLKQQGIDNYQILHGQLAYYAAARAREKNPRAAEMVNAFVISPKVTSAVDRQMVLLNPQSIASTNSPVEDNSAIDAKFQHLESQFQRQIEQLQTNFQQQLSQLSSQLISALTDRVAVSNPPSSVPITSTAIDRPSVLQLLNTRSALELIREFKRSNISGAEKLANNIVTARDRQIDREFVSYDELISSVSGLGQKTLTKIISSWS
jgi:hypothetical protein